MLPTRGVRAAGLGAGPGLGPGVAPGAGPGRVGVGTAGGAAASAGGAAAAAGGAAAAAGGAAAGSAGAAGAFAGVGFVAAGLAGEPLPSVLTFAAAGFAPPNDSRSLRATGASTVEDADLTNSPCVTKPGEHFLAGYTEFLGQLVYAGLACHYISISRGVSGGRRRASG